MNDQQPLSKAPKKKRNGHPAAETPRKQTVAAPIPTLARTQEAAARTSPLPGNEMAGLPPYETVALVLQGGGALGAYQAGVFQGLEEAGISLSWLAGVSIGSLNIAIIAGNPPETRLARLREFWETICQPNAGLTMDPFIEQTLFNVNDTLRQSLSAYHAGTALLFGQNGFFRPRFPPPPTHTPGDPGVASFYDTTALQTTLERLCDFDRINSRTQQVSVGAVNVRTGNLVNFDNTRDTLRAEHFIASGALPPAFAPVEIDGEHYWDGGLVSNTPLLQVLESRPLRDTLAFQVDLWSARGRVPGNMSEVYDRMKDIRYSSRTRTMTEHLRWTQYLRHMLANLLEEIPPERREDDAWCRIAQDLASNKRYNVVHLIYRNESYERHYKDFQFGPTTMRQHWNSGLEDIRSTLAEPERLAMPENASGFVTHDVHREEIEQLMEAAKRAAQGAS
jgi:NTE family protein